MKTARIPTVKTSEELYKGPELYLDQWYEGISEYKPRCSARLVYIDGQGFLAKLSCQESNPRITVTEYDQLVSKDSCLEWFANFDPDRSDLYINMEVNAAGIMLCKVGNTQNRKPLCQIVERPHVNIIRDEDSWSAEMFVPLTIVSAVYGKDSFSPGDVIKSNFYKCGDETAFKHYGMWSRCETEKPNFHRPEFFGTLEIAEFIKDK